MAKLCFNNWVHFLLLKRFLKNAILNVRKVQLLMTSDQTIFELVLHIISKTSSITWRLHATNLKFSKTQLLGGLQSIFTIHAINNVRFHLLPLKKKWRTGFQFCCAISFVVWLGEVPMVLDQFTALGHASYLH